MLPANENEVLFGNLKDVWLPRCRHYWDAADTCPKQAICISGGNGAVEMFLRVKRMTAAGAGLLRKAIPARGWRRYAVGGVVITMAAFGTVTAVTAGARAGGARTVRADGFR